MESFPIDILVQIFRHLDPVDDYPAVVRACKKWNRAAHSAALWAHWRRQGDAYHPLGENGAPCREALFWLQLERGERRLAPKDIEANSWRARAMLEELMTDHCTSCDLEVGAVDLLLHAAEVFCLRHWRKRRGGGGLGEEEPGEVHLAEQQNPESCSNDEDIEEQQGIRPEPKLLDKSKRRRTDEELRGGPSTSLGQGQISLAPRACLLVQQNRGRLKMEGARRRGWHRR